MQSAFQSSLFLLAVVAIGTGCGQSATVENERARLQGTWEVVQRELRGVKVPIVGHKYQFDGQRFRIISSDTDISPWYEYGLNVDTEPKHMDWPQTITGKDGTVEKHTLRVIYRIERDTLYVCSPILALLPRPTAFSSKPDNDLMTLRRIPFANPEEERARNEAARARARDAAYTNLLAASAGKDAEGKYYVDFGDPTGGARNIVDKKWRNLLVLRDIRKLGLRGCTGAGDEQMRYLGKLVSVEILDLHSTDVGDAGIAELGGLVNLRELDLSFTSVGDAGLAVISKLEKLKKLTLKGSLVTEKGIEELRKKRSELEVIWRRPYTKSEQEAALKLSQLGFTVDDDFSPYLYLQPRTVTCQVQFPNVLIRDPSVAVPGVPSPAARMMERLSRGGPDPSVVAGLLEKLPAPTAVTVRNQAMDDTVFVCLQNIHGLVLLDVASTQITDAGLAKLKHHQTLKVLDLRYAKRITDTGVASLAALTNLEVLNLEGIKATSAGLEKLLSLDHLRELWITHRQSDPELNLQFRRKGVKLTY